VWVRLFSQSRDLCMCPTWNLLSLPSFEQGSAFGFEQGGAFVFTCWER